LLYLIRQHEQLAVAGRGAAFEQGYGAKHKENDKRQLAVACLSLDQMIGFTPWVLEFSGRLGASARAFLAQME
jgi:hypothetical protein